MAVTLTYTRLTCALCRRDGRRRLQLRLERPSRALGELRGEFCRARAASSGPECRQQGEAFTSTEQEEVNELSEIWLVVSLLTEGLR